MHGEEGLLLLQHAWNEYDVAKYHGSWYVFISHALTLSYLVLGVFIVILVVILTVFCGDVVVAGTNSCDTGSGDTGSGDTNYSCDTGGNCVLQGLSEKVTERIIFSLTLAVTLIVSLDQCIKPALRAMHLKPAAEKLKSLIWLYR